MMIATTGKRVLLVGALLCIGLATASYFKYRHDSRVPLDIRLRAPKPPLILQDTHFPCLESLAREGRRKRVVVLHGPDWTLDSAVELNCFPEREVVMSVEVGRHFLRQPKIDRIRLWIVKNGDTIYAKIVGSNSSQELDMNALDLVTNHKCGIRGRKNCHVESAHLFLRLD
jgi:hypothetical protein